MSHYLKLSFKTMANIYQCLVLIFVSFISNSKEEFCSEYDGKVNCVPCTEINSNFEPFHCPQQCPKHGQSFCNEACNKFCLNNRCEYEGGSLKCSDGCIDGLTGKYCHETCPENCTKCDQFTGECFCEGDNCREKPTIKPKQTAMVSSATTTSLEKTTTMRSVTIHPSTIFKPSGTSMHATRTSGITGITGTTRTAETAGTAGQPQTSGLRLLLAGVVVAVCVGCSITTITLILVCRQKRKQKRLNV